MAHLKMMGAAQPFISGAISKTVNLPNECTVEDITRHLRRRPGKWASNAWPFIATAPSAPSRSTPRRPTKAATKRRVLPTLPRSKAASRNFEAEIAKLQADAGKPLRRRLPDTRKALTHKFDIAGHEGYLTVGLFEDGQPGELFITMAKEGSTIGGLMDSIGTLTSMALQYGVPLEALVTKFAHQRFEPSGFTKKSRDPQRLVHHRLRLPLAGAAIHPRLPCKCGRRPHPARARHARPA